MKKSKLENVVGELKKLYNFIDFDIDDGSIKFNYNGVSYNFSENSIMGFQGDKMKYSKEINLRSNVAAKKYVTFFKDIFN